MPQHMQGNHDTGKRPSKPTGTSSLLDVVANRSAGAPNGNGAFKAMEDKFAALAVQEEGQTQNGAEGSSRSHSSDGQRPRYQQGPRPNGMTNGVKKPVGKKIVASDSESEEAPKKQTQAKTQAAKKVPAKKKDSDSDDESSEEAPKKAVPAKKAPVKKQDSDDESEEVPKKTAPVKKAPAKKVDSDEEEEEEVKKPVQKSSTQETNTGCTELFVKNLAWSTDENKLYEFFGKYGTVENVKVLYDKNTGKARGLAFVQFSTRGEAQSAIDDSSNLGVDGRTLQVCFSDQKDNSRAPSGGSGGQTGGYTPSNYEGERHTIFVGNLGFKTSEQNVKNFFKDCGNVVDVRIAKDRDTGKSKGFCHVDFDNSSAVEKAKAKAGQDLDGREVRVDASLPRSNAGGSGGQRGGRGGFRGGRGGGRGGSFNPMDRAKKSGAIMQSNSNAVVTFDDDE